MSRLLVLPIVAALGCAAVDNRSPEWWQETAADLGGKLGGCTVADVDPTHPGAEIVVVAGDGRVIVVRRAGQGWEHEVAARLPGEQIQCAAGEFVDTHPGDELIVVGMLEGQEGDGGPGVAYLLWRDQEGWHRFQLLEDTALLHAVAIGDVDPGRPGNEVVVAGFSGRAHVLSLDQGDLVIHPVGPLPGNVKGAAVGLGGCVLACDDGTLAVLTGSVDVWQLEVIANYGDALARVDVSGDDVLVCANDGLLRLWRDGRTFGVHESPERLRGAVIADLDPLSPGDEWATAGYDGDVTVVRAERTALNVVERTQEMELSITTVGSDSDKLHHLAAGELPGLGICLVTCGYSGRVIVVGFERHVR